jgi:Protein of unknown function (DUF1700)
MTKEIYLNELRKRLSLLDAKEVDAITYEYHDHIASKLGDGYSEEEVLEELGDVNQLARKILEAYKISDRYIKWFVGKERMIDDMNEFTNKIADGSIEVFNKIESSVKDVVKKTIHFGENRIHDVKSIFKKSHKKQDDDTDQGE